MMAKYLSPRPFSDNDKDKENEPDKNEDKKLPAVNTAMAFDMSRPHNITTAYSIGASYSCEQCKQLSADGKAKFIKMAT
jgi:hypothetical protein